MKTSRIHITGASGTGATSLGRVLADAQASPHHDTDDYYWLPTAPPYSTKREIPDRLRLMREMFLDRPDWVLSGSLDGWGDPILPYVDLVVFLRVPNAIRLERIRAREARRFGPEAVAPGGWRHREMEAFIAWAAHYEDGSRAGRSLARHQAWLDGLTCRVLRMDGTRPLPDLVGEIRAIVQA